jgi:hypothetical protein
MDKKKDELHQGLQKGKGLFLEGVCIACRKKMHCCLQNVQKEGEVFKACENKSD